MQLFLSHKTIVTGDNSLILDTVAVDVESLGGAAACPIVCGWPGSAEILFPVARPGAAQKRPRQNPALIRDVSPRKRLLGACRACDPSGSLPPATSVSISPIS